MQYGPALYGPRKKPRAYVGYVGYQKTIANNANILHGLRLDIVGSANIANTVRLLHELTIVSLLHELSMVAGDQVREGRGGRALARGQR